MFDGSGPNLERPGSTRREDRPWTENEEDVETQVETWEETHGGIGCATRGSTALPRRGTAESPGTGSGRTNRDVTPGERRPTRAHEAGRGVVEDAPRCSVRRDAVPGTEMTCGVRGM